MTTAVADDLASAQVRVRVELDGAGGAVSARIEGVGELVKIATNKGRGRRPGLKLGVCGEHGGDPESVEFVPRAGLTSVSCSPFRVPVARLEAGRAAVING